MSSSSDTRLAALAASAALVGSLVGGLVQYAASAADRSDRRAEASTAVKRDAYARFTVATEALSDGAGIDSADDEHSLVLLVGSEEVAEDALACLQAAIEARGGTDEQKAAYEEASGAFLGAARADLELSRS